MKRTFQSLLLLSIVGLSIAFAPNAMTDWQIYVDNYLVNNTEKGKTAKNVCQHGAIIGNTKGEIWATTPDFTIGKYSTNVEQEDGTSINTEVDEFVNLQDAFNNNGLCSKLGGIRINKEKYFTVSHDAERQVMYLKKSGGGACIAKTNLGFVIATFNSSQKMTDYIGTHVPQNPGSTNKACEDLQQFLLENNL